MADADREKWDARYRSGQHPGGEPSWLREFEGELPGEGKALDVAAGSGRVSVYLARRGLSVTAIDISPVGLALAREAASDEGLEIRTQAIDLERQPLPEGPFDLVACFHYRQRALFPVILSQLEPGGMVVAELPTLRNLERQMRPSKRWLAEPNELLRDCGSLDVLYYREGWLGERHLARLIARRPKSSD